MYGGWHEKLNSEGEIEYVISGSIYDSIYDVFNEIFPSPFCAWLSFKFFGYFCTIRLIKYRLEIIIN